MRRSKIIDFVVAVLISMIVPCALVLIIWVAACWLDMIEWMLI